MNESSDETTQNAPMYQNIMEKLKQKFAPSLLELFNESHMHSVPLNSETHFKLVMVTENFLGLRPVQRHQSVYTELAEELAGGVHALALHLYTPEEWAQQQKVPDSPNCMGGTKK